MTTKPIKLSQILGELYRHQAHITHKYEPGAPIDFEGSKLVSVAGNVGHFPMSKTVIEKDETVTVESDESLVVTSLDVQPGGDLDVQGELATVGDDDHRDWSY